MVSHKNDPYSILPKFLYTWHFYTHILNKDTHVDRFWCLISKYTEYDNIFIN